MFGEDFLALVSCALKNCLHLLTTCSCSVNGLGVSGVVSSKVPLNWVHGIQLAYLQGCGRLGLVGQVGLLGGLDWVCWVARWIGLGGEGWRELRGDYGLHEQRSSLGTQGGSHHQDSFHYSHGSHYIHGSHHLPELVLEKKIIVFVIITVNTNNKLHAYQDMIQ